MALPMRGVVVTLITGAMGFMCAHSADGQFDGEPFREVTADWIGVSITRPARYDLMPSILIDTDEPPRLFKMWWHGQYQAGDSDLPPADLMFGDRIYYSESVNGRIWSAPRVVLKGVGGRGGYDAADDLMVGSPSVLKINGRYFMFYEAYGDELTAIMSLSNPSRLDTWSTNSEFESAMSLDYQTPCGTGRITPDNVAGYTVHTVLGFAPKYRKTRTHPVWAGEVTYPSGKINRYLSAQPLSISCNGAREGPGRWRALNGGEPVFYLYDEPGTGRKPLFAWFHSQTRNTFASIKDDEGGVADGWHGMSGRNNLLGYVIELRHGRPNSIQDAPDQAAAGQRRICLATSADGLNWTRFTGAASGFAVIAAQNPFASQFPHPCQPPLPGEWNIHRAYGAGHPRALVREGHLELYFTDDSLRDINECVRIAEPWWIRIPVSEIENPQAYLDAPRHWSADYGSDIKWSPMFRRYFKLTSRLDPQGPGDSCDPQFSQSPMISWSRFQPDPVAPAYFPPENSFSGLLPTNIGNSNVGRWGGPGGIAGTALGETIDFREETLSTSLNIYYSGIAAGLCDDRAQMDLDHCEVWLYPKDADDDFAPDWEDNCPFVSNPDQLDTDGNGVGDTCDLCNTWVACDANCDGRVNGDDIQSFGTLLLSGGAACSPCSGDVDHSSRVDANDVAPFVAALLSGGC